MLLANFSCPPDLMQMSPVIARVSDPSLSSDSHESIIAPDASKTAHGGKDLTLA